MPAATKKSRTTWRARLQNGEHSKIVDIPERMRKRFGTGTMLIPKPLDVDALIRRVPKGHLITQSQLRAALARAAGADVACPLVTGIFIRIVAEAAEEAVSEGETKITPYWRVVRDDGALLDKLPGGTEAQGEHLVAEGHAVNFGRRPKVRLVQGVLAELV